MQVSWSFLFVSKKSKYEVFRLAMLLGYLVEFQGFTTSEIVLTQEGNMMSIWNSKPVLIKKFIEGLVVEDIPIDSVVLVGKELAKLHTIPPQTFMPKEMSFGIEHFHEINQYAAGSEYADWLNKKESIIRPFLTDSLPKALIHSDLFSKQYYHSKFIGIDNYRL